MKKQARNTENRTVPIRKPNKELRSREYLSGDEVKRLVKVARDNRHGHRDATMILVTYRHALRATEVCALKWDQFDLKKATLHVNRIKNGLESVHPLGGEELRALRRLLREQPEGTSNMDLSRFNCGPVARLGCFSFELDWAFAS